MDIFVGRQPILTQDEELYGYEILFRDGKNNFNETLDDTDATSAVILNTIYDIGIDKVLNNKVGFINFSPQMLSSSTIIDNLPKDKVVLEILESTELNRFINFKLKELSEKGYTLALDDIINIDEKVENALKYVDIIKVDILGMPQLKLIEIVKKLKKYNKKLLAEKVENKDEFEFCKRLGFELFQGYFFAKPVVIQGKKLNESQHSLIKIINYIERDNIDGVIRAFKESPKLSYQLLNILNSSLFFLKTEIKSIKQAITLLGSVKVKNWITFLLYLEGERREIKCTPLSTLILSRAKKMELFESARVKSDRCSVETAHFVGILSLIDVALQVDKKELFDNFKISDDVKEAILYKRGVFGLELEIVEKIEAQDFRNIDLLLKEIGLSKTKLVEIQKQILKFGHELEENLCR